jgi:hypothetical protein
LNENRTARADITCFAAAGDAEFMHYENDGPVAIIMGYDRS